MGRIWPGVVAAAVAAAAARAHGDCGLMQKNGRGSDWPFGAGIGVQLGQNMVLAASDSIADAPALYGSCGRPNETLTFVLTRDNADGTATWISNATAAVDKFGHFFVRLSKSDVPAATADNHTITVHGVYNDTPFASKAVTEVLFGDLWFCSGQSNMDMQVQETFNASVEVERAGWWPDLCLAPLYPRNQWSPATSYRTAATWSASCYFAAAHFKALGTPRSKRPIGLLWGSFGGTVIETWMGNTSLAACGLQNASCGQPNGAHFDTVDGMRNHSVGTIVWYQGESNVGCNAATGREGYYGCAFRSLITGWRRVLASGQPTPFLFVQLAAYRSGVANNALPALRAAQSTALSLEHTGMAVAIDAGDCDCWNKGWTPNSPHHGWIHPRNKTVVGYRLALALARMFNETVNGTPVASRASPVFVKPSPDNASVVVVTFNQGELGLGPTEDCHYNAEWGVTRTDAPRTPYQVTTTPPCNYSAPIANTAITDCCSSSDHCARHSTLQDAEAACNAENRCSGVTLSPQFSGGYQIRCGVQVASGDHETTWALLNGVECHRGSPTPPPPAPPAPPGPPHPPPPPTAPNTPCCAPPGNTPFEIGFRASSNETPSAAGSSNSSVVFVPARSVITAAGEATLTPMWLVKGSVGAVAVRYAWSDTPPCVLKNQAGLPVAPFWVNASGAVRA